MSASYSASLVFGMLLNIASPNLALGCTGNEFLEDCKNNDSLRQHCVSYVMGMVSAMNGLVSIDASYWWCIWPEVQFTKHLDLLVSFLEENPEERHTTILYNAIEALMVDWPCDYTTTRHCVVNAVVHKRG